MCIFMKEVFSLKITIVLGSNRNIGKHIELMEKLEKNEHEIKYIELSSSRINSCIACEECVVDSKCTLPDNDDFNFILKELEDSDVILIVTPVYAPIPSKLAALFERLLSISFFGGKLGGNKKPLYEKRVGVVTYGANSLYTSDNTKLIIQQFFTNEYSFKSVDYPFIDNQVEIGDKTLIEYTQAIIAKL